MYQIIAKQIKVYRNKLDISLEELSKRTGINISYLKSIEKGTKKPSLLTIEKIAKALNINITNLICEEKQFLKKVEIFSKM